MYPMTNCSPLGDSAMQFIILCPSDSQIIVPDICHILIMVPEMAIMCLPSGKKANDLSVIPSLDINAPRTCIELPYPGDIKAMIIADRISIRGNRYLARPTAV
jgi:hypothetical protein